MTTALVISAAVIAVTALLCFTALRAWRGWLELRRLELAKREQAADVGEADVGLRIELASVRERLKQLEAIASGVEL